MTALENFTRITVTVVQEDGLNGYLPTVMIPATKDIRTIEGIPEDVHRQRNVVHENTGNGIWLCGQPFGILPLVAHCALTSRSRPTR
jgi:hypothetical protein